MTPNDNHTPQRTIRIETQLWEDAKAKAEEKGETLSDVIRRSLERYVKTK